MVEENKLVRWADIYDAERLVQLNDEFNGVGQTIRYVKASLEANLELVVIAVINGQAVGFACAQCYRSFCYSDPQAELTEMYVKEEARGKGLATMMISLLEEGLRDRGVKSVKLLTSVGNEGAISTYERSGYKREDDLLFNKRL